MSKHRVAAWLPLLIKELRSVTLTVHTPLNLFETQTACCFCKEENTRIRGNPQSCQIPDISLCNILLLHFVALTFQRLLQ